VPELLDGMDALPQALPHGDASPQNLLVPADDPGTFVAIDVSFQNPRRSASTPASCWSA